MEKKWIVSLDKVCKTDTKLVGGKCANIGEMVKLGIRVPPGFAVTTAAYNEFLLETHAGKEMEQCLCNFPNGPQSLTEFEEIGRAIREIITSREIPTLLRQAIFEEYEALCERVGIRDLPVAVRSSGVAEDMPTASFAGQYDSYLNMRGKEDVTDKVKLCWASAFNTRCISYRMQNKIGVFGGSISVAVQKMVNSRSAGVGFTVDPVSGDDAIIILEGNWGFGESVVQGVVRPDIFVIDKRTLTLEERQVSAKLRQYSIRDRGTAEEDVPLAKQSLPCLSDDEAIKIAESAKLLELHYGVPIDIEWAVDQDLGFPEGVFLVQVRPVTVVVKKKSTTDQILDLMMSRFYP